MLYYNVSGLELFNDIFTEIKFNKLNQLNLIQSFTSISNNHNNNHDMPEDLIQFGLQTKFHKNAVCLSLPVPQSIFVELALSLLDSSSNSVIYEACDVLLSVTALDRAINRALESSIYLLQSQNDHNVKLIVINKLLTLEYHAICFNNLKIIIMDILCGLSPPYLDIRKQILSLILDLSSINIAAIIRYLQKQIISLNDTNEVSGKENIEYRTMIIETIHLCVIKYPTIASSVIDLLMNYLGDNNTNCANDVILFVKEIITIYPDLITEIFNKLIEFFNDIQSEQVFRCTLWIFAEYCLDTNNSNHVIKEIIDVICLAVGNLPLLKDENDLNKDDNKDNNNAKQQNNKNSTTTHYMTRTVILYAGTYAQETMTTTNKELADNDLNNHNDLDNSININLNKYKLRKLISSGEWYLCSVLALSLYKLILKYSKINNNKIIVNKLQSKILLIITSIIRYATSINSNITNKMDNDTKDRMLYIINKHKN